MRIRLVGRAKASSIKVDQTVFHLWMFRDGLPWRCEAFFDEKDALHKARMTEQEVMPIPIVPVTRDRLAQVVSMSARAFIDEAMFRWVLGEVDDPLSAVEAEFDAAYAVAADLGCLWEAGEALGAATWVSPEASLAYWESAKAYTSQGAGLAAFATDGGRRYEMLYECLGSNEPSEPVWTLDFLTVEPTQQRGGIGSALIEHGLGLARGSGYASFLDTSRPELVGYFARFGFVVTSEADLPEGGPHIWFMVARG